MAFGVRFGVRIYRFCRLHGWDGIRLFIEKVPAMSARRQWSQLFLGFDRVSLSYSPDAIMFENIIIVTNLLHLQIYVKQYECRRLAVMLYIMEHLEYVGIALTFSIWLWWSSEWRAQRRAYWTWWCKCTSEIWVRFVHCSIFRWQDAVPCTLNQSEHGTWTGYETRQTLCGELQPYADWTFILVKQ